MTKRILTTAAALVLMLALVPALVMAQDGDPAATAQAADQAAQQSRQRAASQQATAQAAWGIATAQAAQATDQARIEATATAARATAQVVATDQAIRATEAALSARATGQALDAAATAQALAATATTQALAARDLEAERAALALERDRDRAGFLESVETWGAALVVAIGIAVLIHVVYRAQTAGVPTVTVGALDVIDAEPVPPRDNGAARSPSRPVALLPPETGWTPAYLRPIGADERQYQRAG